MKSGTLLREVINVINKIEFDDYSERHEFNDIYETILKDLQKCRKCRGILHTKTCYRFCNRYVKASAGEKITDLPAEQEDF